MWVNWFFSTLVVDDFFRLVCSLGIHTHTQPHFNGGGSGWWSFPFAPCVVVTSSFCLDERRLLRAIPQLKIRSSEIEFSITTAPHSHSKSFNPVRVLCFTVHNHQQNQLNWYSKWFNPSAAIRVSLISVPVHSGDKDEVGRESKSVFLFFQTDVRHYPLVRKLILKWWMNEYLSIRMSAWRVIRDVTLGRITLCREMEHPLLGIVWMCWGEIERQYEWNEYLRWVLFVGQ